jgi:hypothetical protein
LSVIRLATFEGVSQKRKAESQKLKAERGKGKVKS